MRLNDNMSTGFKYVETKRVSKAQKRRDAKATKKAEQLKRIEDAEKLDEHQDRRIEQENFHNLLASKNLSIHDIEADGDCLYRAVEHQLDIAPDADQQLSFEEIRKRTSLHMQENADNFLPFLLNDNGDLMSDQEFKNYCERISKTKEWGGHLELTAIAQFTGKPVHVYQADSESPIIIETKDKSKKKPILLSFHKHLYHLGEHYNSLVSCN